MHNYILNEGYSNNNFLINKANGPYIYIKNKKYIDLSFSAGCLLLGHQSKIFKKNVNNIKKKNISITASPNNQSYKFSILLKKLFPRVSKFIFCNTGSEAILKSLRIVKAITKKDLIINVSGSWHGSTDKTLFTSGKNYKALPLSEGLSKYDQSKIKFIPYNNIEISKKILIKYKNKISCILIEPIQGGLPTLKSLQYIKFLNTFATKNKILLVFDEIITGLRTNCSSFHTNYNLKPDIFTLGKCFGGGLPIGIIAVNKNVEKKLNKLKKNIFFGGTFSGNSLSTFFGESTLNYIIRNKKKIFSDLEKKKIYFLNNLKNIIKKNNLNISIYNFESIFRIIFSKEKIDNRIQRDFFEKKKLKKIFLFKNYLFSKGIYYPSNGIIFLSTAINYKNLKKIVKTFEQGLKKFF